MLTADLVRVTRRKGVVHPRWLDPADPGLLQTAAELLAVFEEAAAASPPTRRDELDEHIADLVAHRPDPLLFRGLVKLLLDRTEFEQAAAGANPPDLRRALFEAAAQRSVRQAPAPSWDEKRRTLLESVAAAHELSVEALERALFADLPSEQRMAAFDPIDAEGLLHRYNLALAQAVLLRATRLAIHLPAAEVGAVRQVFRDLKFFQLIHAVSARAGGGWDIAVDGPLSLFASSGRYGVAMAQFLPSLVLLERWSLEADVRWGREREPSHFALDERRGLRTARKARGHYVTREQEWLEERFAEDPGPWEMSRQVELLQTAGGAVVVPDLQFRHRDDGRLASLEVLGFWRAGTLQARIDQLADPRLDGLLLAVSTRLAGDRDASERDHPRIVWFKRVIPVAELRQRLEAVARPGEPGPPFPQPEPSE